MVGSVEVVYLEEMPNADEGPFLKEEAKLIRTIAERLGNFVTFRKIHTVVNRYETAQQEIKADRRPEWRVIVDLLKATDRDLYLNVSRKLLNYLCWGGVEEAKKLASLYSPVTSVDAELLADSNVPAQKRNSAVYDEEVSERTFQIASEHLGHQEVLTFIQRWMQQDKLNFLIKALARLGSSLTEVHEVLRRYQRMAPEGIDIPPPTKRGVLVGLIRRLLSEQLEYINVAKNFVEISDIHNLLQNVIYTSESYGKLGGKAAGIILAGQILKKAGKQNELLSHIKTPRAWYLTSDIILHFMNYNNFEEVIEQKYKEVNQVRLEYPNVIQTFKNATFPPEVVQALSVVLDDLGEHPLIVRSSSLLEDRMGTSFSGKYKSLFLANQGDKARRLEALLDAIAEVYASTFGPDPIEYRAERGLLDFHEEMGIIIQEVIGKRIGKYFFPVFAGVAFSKNELRWSSRIKREDGLVRMVMGIGTRAVDRTADDYPILMSPGQPGLRVNVTPDEVVRYSPKWIDVINLETNTFESVRIETIIKHYADEIPMINQLISLDKGDHIAQPMGFHTHLSQEKVVVTFEGLLTDTKFMQQMHEILRTLETTLQTPVDVEFAHDGEDFYLLQCRPQSPSDDSAASPIPRDIPRDRIIFTANKHISNGRVPDITHIVYVDPLKYSELSDRESILAVGRAVSRLNQLLPKRQFILMGPGRWGSRGDMKLGVSVTYSDINNSAVLIEIARQSGHYLPDLSFGTHFFQDLVEARIRYLPLYPEDKGVEFNERFLLHSENLFPQLVPEYAFLADTVHLIDIPRVTDGKVLQILLNAELEEAIGFLSDPRVQREISVVERDQPIDQSDIHWRWRLGIAEQLAAQLDADRFGVKGFYLFGSTKNATAGPASDIDILIHFVGSQQQRDNLNSWLDGWSLCLAEINYQRTGYRTGRLLDVYIVTDEEIAQGNSYALKIGAITDPARPLAIGTALK